MLIFKLMLLGCFILPNRFIKMSNRKLMLTILACFFFFLLCSIVRLNLFFNMLCKQCKAL